MIRTLIASIALTASIAAACPGSGCTDAKEAPALLSVSAPADKADGSCCSDKAAASITEVSAPADKAGSCSGVVCPITGKPLMQVSASGDGASTCAGACGKAGAAGSAATTSFASYIPKMSYKVGDETMTCPKMAGAMASEKNTEMHYVVNGAEFANQEEAMVAQTKQLQAMMVDLVRVQYAVGGECASCPIEAKARAASSESKSLQYKVGPAIFDNAEDAIKASIMAYNAAQKVNIEYVVGNETTTCSVQAGEMAQAAGSSIEYVVNGQHTQCNKAAAYMKTLASVESALKALETASAAAGA